MDFDIFAMMNEQKKEQKEAEEASKEQKATTGINSPKKEEKPKKAKTPLKKEASQPVEESYEYPFSLYTEGHTVDISEYGFEDGRRYTPKQINEIMLKHRHYEFAGKMTYEMLEDDNMLVATAKQYKKG